MMTGPSGPAGHSIYAPPPPRPVLPDPEEDLTPKQLAIMLGVNRSTVQRWCEAGVIPARQIGGRWRIKVSVLKERNPELWEEYAEANDLDADLG